MNRITFTVEAANDGGLVVYSDNGGTTDMNLVFAGNQKETTEYLAKRVGELKAEKVNQVPKSVYAYELPYTVDEDRVTELRRAGAIA
jgi:hypothetical protein